MNPEFGLEARRHWTNLSQYVHASQTGRLGSGGMLQAFFALVVLGAIVSVIVPLYALAVVIAALTILTAILVALVSRARHHSAGG